MTKFLYFFCVLCAGFFHPLQVHADPFYVSVLPDIPIPPGFHENIDDGVAFDKASGRVVEAVLMGQNDPPSDPLKFYQETLPALGWNPVKPTVFVRKGEQLIVKEGKVGGGTRIDLLLVPK